MKKVLGLTLLIGGMLLYAIAENRPVDADASVPAPKMEDLDRIVVSRDGGCWSNWNYSFGVSSQGEVMWQSSFGVDLDSASLSMYLREKMDAFYQRVVAYKAAQRVDDVLLQHSCGPSIRVQFLAGEQVWAVWDDRTTRLDQIVDELEEEVGIAAWFEGGPFLPIESEASRNHPGFDDW